MAMKLNKEIKEKLSNYLIDVSKYILTGVVVASLFKDLEDERILVYSVGFLAAFLSLYFGLSLISNKKTTKKR